MDVLEKWKKLALEDMAQAVYLRDGEFYRGACYNAQQAAGEAIKYALLKKGWDLERTHNIRRLVSLSQDYHISLSMEEEALNFIDSIYIGRYPAEEGLLPEGFPDKADCERTIKIAQDIFRQLAF